MKEQMRAFQLVLLLTTTGCLFSDNGTQAMPEGMSSAPYSSEMVTLNVTNAPITDVVALLNAQLSDGNDMRQVISIRGADVWSGEYYDLPANHDPFRSLSIDDWVRKELTPPEITISRTNTSVLALLDEIKTQHLKIRVAVFENEIIVLLQPPNVARHPFDSEGSVELNSTGDNP